ncbi:MAG: hypothetical protein EA390_10320 [Balneolaceae bacterium]|nr:MAG: hypothetical protein EA390_10320 [Balneolaceae bacterium]
MESVYDRRDVNRLIKTSYNIALSYLNMKSASKNSFFLREENIEDLAWDFIADLFQKDEEGNLVAIQSYFRSCKLDELSEESSLIELRKLVFTKVDDNIFRFYGEKDPSLRKIIRNIKLAVKDQECKNRVCYRDGYLIVGDVEEPSGPMMPYDFMSIRLCSRLRENYQIPDVIIEVIDIINSQNEYRKRFSLVGLASIIRESYVLLQDDEFNTFTNPKAVNNLFEKEFDIFLDDSVDKVKTTVGDRYIKKGKLKKEYLNLYFRAASDIVRNDFKEELESSSQYERLKSYVNDLDYEQYRENHRPVLEYIVKLIRQDLIENYRKEWVRF